MRPGSGFQWEIDPDRNAALLASVVDSGPDGVIVVDREGRVVLANRTASSQFGYLNEEFLGIQVDTLVPSGHRAGHRAHRVGFERRPSARPMGIGLDLQAQRKDGSAFPVEISLAGVVVFGERFTIATVRDVTERRAMRLELPATAERSTRRTTPSSWWARRTTSSSTSTSARRC